MPSSQNIVLEVCVDSVQSALSAAQGGADRLEVCGNLGVGGGTTPSLGLVREIQKAVPHLPIMVMIRPRAGDFCYSKEELNVMLEDIRLFKDTLSLVWLLVSSIWMEQWMNLALRCVSLLLGLSYMTLPT
ncbi:CutC family-domain-containing protein, partial [Russula compacta]